MASLTQTVQLRYTTNDFPPVVYMVQGDTGRQLVCQILDYNVPAGSSATLLTTRANGTFITNPGTIDGNSVTIDIANGVLNHAGTISNQLLITDSDTKTVRSFSFIIRCQKNDDGEATPEDISFLANLRSELESDFQSLESDLRTWQQGLTALLPKHGFGTGDLVNTGYVFYPDPTDPNTGLLTQFGRRTLTISANRSYSGFGQYLPYLITDVKNISATCGVKGVDVIVESNGVYPTVLCVAGTQNVGDYSAIIEANCRFQFEVNRGYADSSANDLTVEVQWRVDGVSSYPLTPNPQFD